MELISQKNIAESLLEVRTLYKTATAEEAPDNDKDKANETKQSASEGAEALAQEPLVMGTRVTIHSLKNASAQHRNGQQGTVLALDESNGRYAVQLDDRSLLSLKLDNLQRDEQAQRDADLAKKEQEKAQRLTGALEEALPKFLQLAWAAVVRDLDSTMREVCTMLLQDKSVSWQIRVRRAQGLQLLGQIFVAEGEKATAAQQGASSLKLASGEAKALLQEAMMAACKK